MADVQTDLTALRDELLGSAKALELQRDSIVATVCAEQISSWADRLTAALGSLPQQEKVMDVSGTAASEIIAGLLEHQRIHRLWIDHFEHCAGCSDCADHVVQQVGDADTHRRHVEFYERAIAYCVAAEALAVRAASGDKADVCSCGHRREAHHVWGKCHGLRCKCTAFIHNGTTLGSLPVPDTEALRERIESLRRYHVTCEDGWYSCPLSPEGCIDDREDGCTCGALEHNIRVDALLSALLSRSAQD